MIHLTYFVHGTTTDNEANISSGWNDCDLSPLGVQQSLALKEALKDKQFDVVFSSNLLRARHSAELVFGHEVKIDQRLRECNYGDYNGGPNDVVEPLQEKYIEEKFPNGESYEDVKKRMGDFLDFLKKEYDGKTVAIVSHKAPQLALDVLLKNKTWAEAHAEDWRRTKSWQPGWEYIIN